jgi:hypothetical protein
MLLLLLLLWLRIEQRRIQSLNLILILFQSECLGRVQAEGRVQEGQPEPLTMVAVEVKSSHPYNLCSQTYRQGMMKMAKAVD